LIHTGFRFQPEPGVFHVLNLVLSYHHMNTATFMPARAGRMKFWTLSNLADGGTVDLLRMKYAEGLTDAEIGERIGRNQREAHRARLRAERLVRSLLAVHGRRNVVLDLIETDLGF
jgi:hypothetical protein